MPLASSSTRIVRDSLGTNLRRVNAGCRQLDFQTTAGMALQRLQRSIDVSNCYGTSPYMTLSPLCQPLRAVARAKDITDELACGMASHDKGGKRQARDGRPEQSPLTNHRTDRGPQ